MKKRIVPIVLALLLLFGITACAQQPAEAPAAPAEPKTEAPAPAPTASLAQQLSAMFASGAPVDEELAAVLAAEPRVVGINARINGETSILLTEPADFIAQAVLPEGMVVDHWEINGVPVDSAGRRYTLEFSADGPTFVAAVLRPELKVTSINATMQFLNENGKPAGPVFDEFVFEEDYINEATGKMHPRGTITVNVKADVPEGFKVDYWLINDVPYFYNSTVTSFTVVNLDETTVYEIVLRGEKDEPTDPSALMNGEGSTPVIPGDEPYAPPASEPGTPAEPTPAAPDATPDPFGIEEEETPTPDPFGIEEEETPEPVATASPSPSSKPTKPSKPKTTPKPSATTKPIKPTPTPDDGFFDSPIDFPSRDNGGDSGSSDYPGDSGSSDYPGDSGSSDYPSRPDSGSADYLPFNPSAPAN